MTTHAGEPLGLPHDAPALIIEAVEEEPAGRRCAMFEVRDGSHWVIGDRLSAAGVVEAMAQAAALCADRGHDAATTGQAGPMHRQGVVIGAEALDITCLPCRGQTARARSISTRAIGSALWVDVELQADGTAAARGVVKLFLGPETAADRPLAQSAHRYTSTTDVRQGIRDDVRAAVLERLVRSDGCGLDVRCRYPATLPIFAGHFPGRPLVPGVYLLQLALELLPAAGVDTEPPITVARAKLARPLLPEQEHLVELRISKAEPTRQRIDLRVRTSDTQRRPAAEMVLELGRAADR